MAPWTEHTLTPENNICKNQWQFFLLSKHNAHHFLEVEMAKKKKKKRRRRSGKSVSPQSKERTYQAGLSYFRNGEYDQAIHAWGSIVGSSGPKIVAQLAEAHFRNAMSKYESGDIRAVISDLHSALKYNSSQPVYLFHIGLAYQRREKLSQAISYYTQAIQAAPEIERYKFHLGLAYLQNGEIQESIKLFETVNGSHNRIGEILVYMSQGEHERALEVLDKVRNSSETQFLKGLVYLMQEDDRKAKPLLKAAASKGLGNGVSDYYLGLAHARTNTIPSAIKAWEDAARKGLDIELMKDGMADVYRQLVVRYFDRGNLDKVVKIWEKLLAVEPEDDAARRNLVHAYLLRGNDHAKVDKLTYAIKYWEKAWELDSKNVDVAHNLALAYEKRDNLGEAAKYWKAAVGGWKQQMSTNRGEREVLKARMSTVHTHLADIALKTDNMGRAIVEYRQALRYAPEEVKTIVKLANVYMMQRNADKAIQQLSRARRLSPKDTDVLQQLSFAYVMKGNLEHSMECMKEILKIDPGNQTYRDMVSQYYLSRAEDALAMRRHPAALRLLDEGLEVDENNIELQAFIGAVYLDMGDKLNAEAAFRETIAINSTDAKTYIAVAHHYLDNSMMDDAEAYFAGAISLDPNNPHVYIDIADEYCNLDICEHALRYFEMAKKVKPGDVSALITIVEKLMARRCSEHGVQYAKELMSIAPNAPKSYFLLGLAYHLSDMDDEAEDTLLDGLSMAEEADDDEMIDEINSLLDRINFENTFGGSWESMMDRLMGDFFDEEEW